MKRGFVGYGSLISHNSLKETIPNKHFTPVIVKGYKRVFNLIDGKGSECDVLNLEKSKKSFFNGVMFRLTEKELEKIKEREPEYNLEEARVYDFLTGKFLGKCFVVIDYYISIDKKNKKPEKKYFILCREAAYHISRQFGEYWDKTSYLSGGERITEWIKKNKKYNSLNILNDD